MFDDATPPDDDASDQPVDDVVNDSDASADVGQEPEAEEPEAEEPEAEAEATLARKVTEKKLSKQKGQSKIIPISSTKNKVKEKKYR